MKKIILVLCLVICASFGENISDFTKKCKEGDASYCHDAGVSYYFGQNGAQQDYLKAIEYYQKGCDNKIYRSCSNLGIMYSDGFGVNQDYKKAIELHSKACNGGNAPACSNLGAMYFLGQGVKKDIVKSASYFRKACNGKDWIGCFKFAIHNEVNLKDNKKAMQFYKKACDLGKKEKYLEKKEMLDIACSRYAILR